MLHIQDTGSGLPLLLLHGLTATNRYVLHGSRLLERKGFRLIAYDARAHGESDPADDPSAYEYADMADDVLSLLDERQIERAVLVGHSMGATTAMLVALEHPERVSGLVQVTPAYYGQPYAEESHLAYWDRLAAGLESDGADGFMRVFEPPPVEKWREPVLKFTRQRIERHRHPEALADAVRIIPRSAAWDGLDRLAEVEQPVLIVGSRDESDPTHPLLVAEEYTRRLRGAEFAIEDPGHPPLAWQGSRLSREILEWLSRTGLSRA